MRLALVLLLVILTASCAGRVTPAGTARITLPQPPKRIAVREDGMQREAGVEYIDPAIRIAPGKCAGIPETGGALLTPRSWRAVKYALTEWPKWGTAVQSIVDSHNGAIEPPPDTRPGWWPHW